jgi:hypothetical protein
MRQAGCGAKWNLQIQDSPIALSKRALKEEMLHGLFNLTIAKNKIVGLQGHFLSF